MPWPLGRDCETFFPDDLDRKRAIHELEKICLRLRPLQKSMCHAFGQRPYIL